MLCDTVGKEDKHVPVCVVIAMSFLRAPLLPRRVMRTDPDMFRERGQHCDAHFIVGKAEVCNAGPVPLLLLLLGQQEHKLWLLVP